MTVRIWYRTLILACAAAAVAAWPLSAEDLTKRKLESPAEETLAGTAPASPAPGTFENPRVEPGKVTWHTDFQAACEASRESGKPVLLLQMMGNLDQQFC